MSTNWVVPYHVTYGSGSFSGAPISGHHPEGQACSRLSDRNRHSLSQPNQPMTTEWSPSRNRNPNLSDMGNSNSGHVCYSPQHPSPQLISQILEPQALAIEALSQDSGMEDVHVSTVSLAQQIHSESMCHPGRQANSYCPLVADTAMVPTPASTVCGPPSHHSILRRGSSRMESHTICTHEELICMLPKLLLK